MRSRGPCSAGAAFRFSSSSALALQGELSLVSAPQKASPPLALDFCSACERSHTKTRKETTTMRDVFGI